MSTSYLAHGTGDRVARSEMGTSTPDSDLDDLGGAGIGFLDPVGVGVVGGRHVEVTVAAGDAADWYVGAVGQPGDARRARRCQNHAHAAARTNGESATRRGVLGGLSMPQPSTGP